MLQVLVSIQGLVLVDKPYYNEAGYEAQVGSEEGERNGAQYNEQAFLASAKSMLSLLKKPPKHFERLIREHFRARGGVIVRACEAYSAGARSARTWTRRTRRRRRREEEEEEDAEESRGDGGGGGEITEAEEPPAARARAAVRGGSSFCSRSCFRSCGRRSRRTALSLDSLTRTIVLTRAIERAETRAR